jgi:CRP/FNR family transcriptional regulator, cyclic AMP receptor protein
MTADQLDQIFAARGWLSLQPPAFRRAFLSLGRVMTLGRGDPVYHSGDDAGGVYGIVAGGIAVLGGSAQQVPVMAHVGRAGDWFGFGPLLSGGVRKLSFVAIEASQLVNVPLTQLRPRMKADGDFASRLGQMADIATSTVISVSRDLLTSGAAQRLAAVLLRVTVHGEVPPPSPEGYALTQSELGEMANISRHQVNRILSDMQKSGWVRLGYNRIALIDVPALAGFAYAEH